MALLSALAFGLTTPLIQRLSRGVGVLPAAALLYAGAALASLNFGRESKTEAPVSASQVARLVAVALCGAVAAPVCLIWGLQRTDAVNASLLLNFEAVFTVLLAWAVHREPIGVRVTMALAAMFAGGALLASGGSAVIPTFGWGALAVVSATLGWALDNTLSRPLAELRPTRVVMWKGGFGALLGTLLALSLKQPFPSLLPLLGLLACGATGYGLSLQLYLRAQRKVGAARTGSIFAVAPFIGALAAWCMGGAPSGAWSAGAAACFGLAVYLHLTEGHGHFHSHAALTHEHPHRHDDGHHEHQHLPPFRGEHTHSHSHQEQTHDHPHAPDVHHRHEH